MTPELSKEARNRLLIWKMALHSALSNLKAAGHIWTKQVATGELLQTNNNCSFEHVGMPCSVNVPLTAWRALTEVSLVLVRQVFVTGKKGAGIAANKNDDEIEKLRLEVESSAKSKLGWSDDEYKNFYALIRSRVDETLAHYDGVTAGYEELPGMTKMKMVGGILSLDEIQKLELFVTALEESVHEQLVFLNSENPESSPSGFGMNHGSQHFGD